MRLDHHPALDARALLPFLAARAVPGVEEVVDGVYRRAWPTARSSRCGPANERVEVEGPVAAARACCASTWTRTRSSAASRLRSAARPVRPCRAGASHPGPPRPGRARRARPARPADLGRRRAHARGAARGRRRRAAGAAGGRASRTASRRPRRWPRSTRRRCRCPAPAPRALVGMAGQPFGEHLPGVGPWTVAYVALRSGDDDAFLPTDLGVRHGLVALGADPLRAAGARRGVAPVPRVRGRAPVGGCARDDGGWVGKRGRRPNVTSDPLARHRCHANCAHRQDLVDQSDNDAHRSARSSRTAALTQQDRGRRPVRTDPYPAAVAVRSSPPPAPRCHIARTTRRCGGSGTRP